MTGSSSVISSSNFTDLFYPLIVSAVLSLIANMCFPRTGRDAYFEGVFKALEITSQLIDEAVETFDSEFRLCITHQELARKLTGSVDVPPALSQSVKFMDLRKQLGLSLTTIRNALAATSHELTYCRVPVNKMGDLSVFLGDLDIWITCGFGMEKPLYSFELSSSRYQRESDFEYTVKETPLPRSQGTPQLRNNTNQDTICSDEQHVPHDQQHNVEEHITQPESEANLLRYLEPTSTLGSLVSNLQDALATILTVAKVCYGLNPVVTRHNVIGLSRSLTENQGGSQSREIIRQCRDKLQESIDACRHELHDLIDQRQSVSSVSHNNQYPVQASSQLDSGTSFEMGVKLQKPSLFRDDMYVFSLYALSMIEISYRTVKMLDNIAVTVEYFEQHQKRQFYFSTLDLKRWFTSSSDLDLFQKATDFSAMNDSRSSDQEVSEIAHSAPEDHHEKKIGRDREFLDDVLHDATYRAYAMSTARASRYTHAHEDLAERTSWSCRVLLLSIPAFLEPGATSWWNSNHAQWMVISYIWCLEGSTGDTIKTSICRVVGTFIGVVAGIVCSEISRDNQYGLGALIVLFEIPASILRLHSPYSSIGAVMGVTTPVVALGSYFVETSRSSGHVGIIRGYMICIGIGAALIMNIAVWPYHARTQLCSRFSVLASDLQTMYMKLTRHMLYFGFHSTPKFQRQFSKMERKVRSTIGECNGLMLVMDNEVSLLLKPTLVMNQILLRLHTIFVLLAGLRLCREHGLQSLRQKAIWDVADLRQELASAVMLDLWIIEQSMLTRSRMPQFLPSARQSLDTLTAALAYNHGEVFYDRDQDQVQVLKQPRLLYDAPRLCYDFSADRQEMPKQRRHNVQSSIALMQPSRGMPQKPWSISGEEHGKIVPTKDGTLYLLAEHALLAQLVSSLEALLHLTRNLLGELRIINPDSIV
ncbi:hypothetical protein MYAM1_002336 [Malassezia yamatoensis]|uniref:Integral membrane bound transporter domain-containing protein n=1 Tax=Malassezia yamatoensis TaxID=253288 RepID=A0AAJ5YVP9_9BASI|nr:hypothetical protein MYAM1_002336 [Malassezia yamatoensis]